MQHKYGIPVSYSKTRTVGGGSRLARAVREGLLRKKKMTKKIKTKSYDDARVMVSRLTNLTYWKLRARVTGYF